MPMRGWTSRSSTARRPTSSAWWPTGQAEFGVADATDVMIARTQEIPIKYVRPCTRVSRSR